MKRADLEQAMSAVPDFSSPQPSLEQYRTPPQIAAQLLWAAHEDDCIRGRRVLDLGCGTGIFSLGAMLLGAASVVGVDADAAALDVAREHAPDASFVRASLPDWTPPEADTAIMNPPFGAQKKGADRPFYETAARAVADQDGTCWFLAQQKTERFLAAMARDLGADLERVASWDYPIEARFGFHDDAVRTFVVAGYRMGWD